MDDIAQSLFGAERNGGFDHFTDGLTLPFYWAGNALNGALTALTALTALGSPSPISVREGLANISTNERGGVAAYINEDGIRVTTNPDSYYTQNLLEHYGVEIVRDDGPIIGRTTFGATMRAIADGLGLDGEFGIQGNFANPGEGTAGNGVQGEGGSDSGGSDSGGSDDSGYGLDDFVDDVVDFVNDVIDFANDLVDAVTGTSPIIFDLDGDGVQITELSNSSIYMDATGDGLENRTAWAGAGDAVLFYDPDNTGEITEMRQYVFTEWDPTASSDMEALASVFDTNGDGVLDASGDVRRLAANANRPLERPCLRSGTC